MFRHPAAAALALACICGFVSAQTAILVPPAAVPSVGTCNVIPFGSLASFSAGYTYVAKIPAAVLSAADTRLVDVNFAPCALGTWSAPVCQIAVGHLPSLIVPPLAFPVIGTSLGAFLDLTVLWDSTAQGAFSWTGTANTWSSLGFATAGGTTFCWNGVDDVGFYITYQTSTVTWDGACHRTNTDPYRYYAAGYQAAASTGIGASGLIMKLDFQPCAPAAWQVNSPTADLNINGLQGTPYAPAVQGAPLGSTVTVSFNSPNAGLPWETIVTLVNPIVPFGGGGIATLNGQFLNVDLISPIVFFLNGGPVPSFSTPFPGSFSTPLPVGNVPLTMGAQMLIYDFVHPDGFVLTQATQLNVP